jgi:hypothetical protein
MPTSASSEAHSSIDLSELLSFNVSFKNLEFVLRTVLSRLDNVEHTVAENHDTSVERDRELTDALDDAKRQLDEQKDIQAALSERCNELARQVAAADALAKQAQDRADDAHKRIDALSKVTSPPPAAPLAAPVESAVGKNYDDEIAALQRAVEHLEEAKADKKIEDDVRAVEEGIRGAEDKLATLQAACDQMDEASKQRDDDLAKRLDALAAAIPSTGAAAATSQRSPSLVPSANNNDWIAPLSKLTNTVDRIKADQDALNAKLAALAGLTNNNTNNNTADSGISPAQFALLQAAVNELEKRPLSKDYDQAIELLNQQVRALGNECSANAAESQRLDDTKANKADLDALANAVAATAKKGATSPVAAAPLDRANNNNNNNQNSSGDGWVKPVADTNRRIDDLQKQLGGLEGIVRGIDIHRVERNVTSLGDDVDRLRAAVDELRKNSGGATGAGGATGGSDANRGKGGDEALASAMQKQLNDILADTAQNIDWTKGQILEIRATIEHIHHTKADTALVANKAERDFVENSMEKLMREVEQVLNATNAGLIDTLDKSLNILRDMIDGKATKQDVVKLQTMINEDQLGGGGNGNVPEGLTGFKSYRCLGCNRTMDGMRQRPMGANFSTFMNRLPPNSSSSASRPGTTNPQQQVSQARVAVAGPSPPAGYIGNTPQSR